MESNVELEHARERIAELELIILTMAEKIASMAFHLGRLSERKEVRDVGR